MGWFLLFNGYRSIYIIIVWSCFCYRCKELVSTDLLDTYKVILRCVENILRGLFEKFWLKNSPNSEISTMTQTVRPFIVVWDTSLKLFKKSPSEYFLRTVRWLCKYLVGLLTLVLYNGNKIMIIRCLDPKITIEKTSQNY